MEFLYTPWTKIRKPRIREVSSKFYKKELSVLVGYLLIVLVSSFLISDPGASTTLASLLFDWLE